MVGIILGVWALITVMSIMNGFHKDLRDRILYVVSHVTVSAQNDYLSDWEIVAEQFLDHILRSYREQDAQHRGQHEGMDYLNELLHAWANKLLAGLITITVLISKVGCPRCRSASSTKKKPVPKMVRLPTLGNF